VLHIIMDMTESRTCHMEDLSASNKSRSLG
jgi:hypothetical protein